MSKIVNAFGYRFHIFHSLCNYFCTIDLWNWLVRCIECFHQHQQMYPKPSSRFEPQTSTQ